MIRTLLIDSTTGETLDTDVGLYGDQTLLTESLMRLRGGFKTITVSNDTDTVASPEAGGALQLTDLIMTSGKKVGGFATLNWYTAANTVVLLRAEADYGIQLAIPFQGCWRGWKDAYIQLVVSAAFDVTVAIGYIKIPLERALSYAAWDALR